MCSYLILLSTMCIVKTHVWCSHMADYCALPQPYGTNSSNCWHIMCRWTMTSNNSLFASVEMTNQINLTTWARIRGMEWNKLKLIKHIVTNFPTSSLWMCGERSCNRDPIDDPNKQLQYTRQSQTDATTPIQLLREARLFI